MMTTINQHHSTDQLLEVCRSRGWRVLIDADFFPNASSDIVPGLIRKEHKDNLDILTKIPGSKYAQVIKAKASLRGRLLNCYIKRYKYRNIADLLKHIFRPGRARRALRGGNILAANNLLTPKVLALAENKIIGITSRSFIITSAIENTFVVHEQLLRLEQKEKTKMLRQLGEYIGRLHKAEIFHGDLRLGNILAGVENGQWKFWLLDNERTVQFQTLPKKLRIKNLVQANFIPPNYATTKDRLIFFNAYIKQNPQLEQNKKQLMRTVTNKTIIRLNKKCEKTS